MRFCLFSYAKVANYNSTILRNIRVENSEMMLSFEPHNLSVLKKLGIFVDEEGSFYS